MSGSMTPAVTRSRRGAISKHGHALSVVGELLGHSQAATTKRYTHLHDEAAKTAVRQIGGTIAAALKRKVSA